MRLLVRHWNDGEGDDQRQEIIDDNLLGKKTKARSTDVYRRSFTHRFLNGDPPSAWRIVRPLEDREVPVEILRPVYYWITARSEPVVYDFVLEEVFRRSKASDLSIRVDETVLWIKKKLSERNQSWSETVSLKVARGLLAALRDFGILDGVANKRIAPVYLPVESFAYLAFVMYKLRLSGERLIMHPDWKLFLMEPSVVENLFLEAHQNRFLHYDAAGKIHRIEFFAHSMEGMADVVAGRRD
jgi:hypothetical protein